MMEKNKKGRPSNGLSQTSIGVSMTSKLRRRIERGARKSKMSLAEYARHLFEVALDAEGD